MTQQNSSTQTKENSKLNMFKYTELREIMDANEMADFLRISKSKLYQMTSKNEIPFYKQGVHVLFSRSVIMEWLEKFKQMDVSTANESANDFIASNRK